MEQTPVIAESGIKRAFEVTASVPRLRVAYLLHRFPHLTETFVTRELLSMRALGIDVEIFSLLPPKHKIVHDASEPLLPFVHYRPLLSRRVVGDQLHYVRRSPSRYLRSAWKVVWYTWREPVTMLRALSLFPKAVSFARQIERDEIDHVHAHFVWMGAIAASVASTLIDITYTVHPHAFGLFARNQSDVRAQLRDASGVVAISAYHASRIADICPELKPEEVTIVHLGVDTDTFRPRPDRALHDPPVVLSVGRLIRKKGHEYLIAACRLLADRGIDFQCWFVGDGPLRRHLEALVEQHDLRRQIRFLGSVSQEAVRTLYQQSCLFALPCVTTRKGDQDGMPYVLIEAMACGLPVVTTAVAGIPDLVRTGENGLLVRQRDVDGLAEALERLILEPDLRQRLGEQARRTVVDEFHTLRNAERLAGLFGQICLANRHPVHEGGPLK